MILPLKPLLHMMPAECAKDATEKASCGVSYGKSDDGTQQTHGRCVSRGYSAFSGDSVAADASGAAFASAAASGAESAG